MLINGVSRGGRLLILVLDSLLLMGIYWSQLAYHRLSIIWVIAAMVAYLGLLALTFLGEWVLLTQHVAQLTVDLGLFFGLYALLLLSFPQAFRTGLGGGPALLFSVVGLPLPYVPRNGWVGVRVPWTMTSPLIWHKTNLLAARFMVPFGGVLLLANLVGASLLMLVVGTGLLVVTVGGYSYWLTH